MHKTLRFPALAVLAAVLLGAACLLASGPLPGDVALTRALQSVFGDAPGWAIALTRSAQFPLVWATLAVAMVGAFARGGARGAAAPVLAFLAVLLLDKLLRAAIFAPKPSADLVAVAAASASSGLPSTFALHYGALFGAAPLAPGRRGPGAAGGAGGRAAAIAAGCAARVVLGGHWTSQMLATLLLALAVASLCHAALRVGDAAPSSAPAEPGSDRSRGGKGGERSR
mgnify:CR=1 FL=1